MIEKAGESADDYDGMDPALKDTLAITEHLRWNATNEVMGYTYGKTKDYKLKTHPCIRPWEDLTEEEQSYDYLVVKTTMRMKR